MDVCRACMCENNGKNLQSLFKRKKLRINYECLTNINIVLNDGLSKKICINCIKKLSEFDEFKIQCIKSNELLKQYKLNCDDDDGDVEDITKVTNNNMENNNKEEDHNDNNDDNEEKSIEIAVDPLDYNETDTNLDSVDDYLIIKLENHMITYDVIDNKQTNNDHDKDATIVVVAVDDQMNNNIQLIENRRETFTENGSNVDDDQQPARNLKRNAETSAVTKKCKTVKLTQKSYSNKQHFPYKCNECGAGFVYQERYEGHLRKHEGKKAAICEYCGNGYSEWSYLKEHIEKIHKSVVKYKCHCGKVFAYESGLLAHKLSHERPEFICEECGMKFFDSYQLKIHFVKHQKEKPFICDACGKKFKTEFQLRSHKLRHNKVGNHPCTTCGESFGNLMLLKEHMRTHGDDLKFDCKICGKWFKKKADVTVHTRIEHIKTIF